MGNLVYTCLDDLCKDCRDLLLFSFTDLQLLIVLCLLVWAAFWPVMSETGFHRCQEAHLLLQGLIPGSSSVSGDGQEAVSPSGALLGVPGVGRAEM